MKISLTAKNFLDALNPAASAVATRTTLPILCDVLMYTTGSDLLISGTNLESASTRAVTGAYVYEEGAICIPAKLLAKLAKAIPAAAAIEIETGPECKMSLTYPGTSITLRGDDPEDFPVVHGAVPVGGRSYSPDRHTLFYTSTSGYDQVSPFPTLLAAAKEWVNVVDGEIGTGTQIVDGTGCRIIHSYEGAKGYVEQAEAAAALAAAEAAQDTADLVELVAAVDPTQRLADDIAVEIAQAKEEEVSYQLIYTWQGKEIRATFNTAAQAAAFWVESFESEQYLYDRIQDTNGVTLATSTEEARALLPTPAVEIEVVEESQREDVPQMSGEDIEGLAQLRNRRSAVAEAAAAAILAAAGPGTQAVEEMQQEETQICEAAVGDNSVDSGDKRPRARTVVKPRYAVSTGKIRTFFGYAKAQDTAVTLTIKGEHPFNGVPVVPWGDDGEFFTVVGDIGASKVRIADVARLEYVGSKEG